MSVLGVDWNVLVSDLDIETIPSVDESQPLLLVQYMYSFDDLSSHKFHIGLLSLRNLHVETDIGCPVDNVL